MQDSWEPINMLPDDGRTTLFTRSVNPAGNVIHFTTPTGLAIVEGNYDENGLFVLGDIKEGEIPDEDRPLWAPTHFYNDVGHPVVDPPPPDEAVTTKATRRRHPAPQPQPDPAAPDQPAA
jgi:hypothetical protein